MKSSANGPAAEGPTSYGDGSDSTIAVLVALVQLIVEQSGNPQDFDAESWLTQWLHSPVPALGSRPPIELLGTPDGVALVSLTIARMQSGAFM
ncbi:MbcA/ParS/Xre antitoxin family protein [Paraburkholderia nemoris]